MSRKNHNVSPLSDDVHPKALSIYWEFGGQVIIDQETPQPFKAITVTVGGLVKWVNLNDEIQEFSCTVPGQIYPIIGKKIISGTTATGIYWAGGI